MKINENNQIKPEWYYCPKCKSGNIQVEKCVFYVKTFSKGRVRKIELEVEPTLRIGPTATTCIECGYVDEEDVE